MSDLTDDDRRLWKKYFGANLRGHHPVERDNMKQKALRCSACTYIASGWVHIDWHERQTPEAAERMRLERIEKLGS